MAHLAIQLPRLPPRLDREPFRELVPQPETAITPTIINNTSSVAYLRKYALDAKRDEGGRYCCLDLADAEGCAPRNTP